MVAKTRKKTTYIAKELPAEGYARLPAVVAAFGCSKNTYLRYAAKGIYPKGFMLSPGVRVYPVDEIREALARLKSIGSK